MNTRKLALDLRWGGIIPFLVVGKACPQGPQRFLQEGDIFSVDRYYPQKLG